MSDVKPVINSGGKLRPAHSGETVGVGNGGTGAATASAARTALGVAIGTDVQAQSANLAALAGVTSAADKLFYFTGAGAGAVTTLSSFARSILDDADAATVRATIGAGTGSGSGDLVSTNNLSDLANAGTALTNLGLSSNGKSLVTAANYGAMRTALSLVPGTDVQAFHARLADLAGITYAQGDILYFNGSNLVKLAAGTSGKFLKTQGAGANPAWDTPGGSGGGGGFLSVQDHFYKVLAEANMSMTSGASGTLYDKVTDKGGFVIMALAGVIVGVTLRPGTTYTVPAGKIAVCVDMRFDVNTLNSNATFYKHRLFNVTANACNIAASSVYAGTGATSMFAYNSSGGVGSSWPAPIAAITTTIPIPVVAGTAGQVLRAEIGGGNDASGRPTYGMYVLAIIDATTHLLEPITA